MILTLPAGRVAVKICGVTNRDDALGAVKVGADVLGFNTWTGSKRYLDLETNASWIAGVPVSRVALLVNASLEEAARVAALPFIDALQLHGDEDATYCAAAAQLGKPIIKALRVRGAEDFAAAESFGTPRLLLDAQVPGAYGGTGARVEVGLVQEFSKRHPNLELWLAGGLLPGNVADAVRAVRPRVVDVSSGVESQPGKKDFARMQAFCAAARGA